MLYRKLPRRPASLRRWVSTVSKPFFVTTPIFYVNGDPHLGHLFSSMLADTAARHARLASPLRGTLFSTGTDEHGAKVADAAAKSGAPTPAVFCDAVSVRFNALGASFGISPDVFVRTTHPSHARVVAWLWRRLSSRGAIYLGRHEGWYCRSDEAFLSDSQAGTRFEFLRRKDLLTPGQLAVGPPAAPDTGGRLGDPTDPMAAVVSLESGHPVEWLTEQNYRFRLGAQVGAVEAWLGGASLGAPSSVSPPQFVHDVRAMLLAPTPGGEDARDVSVSRRRDAVPWALQVPGDAEHSVYVWVDALASYLTVALHPRWAAAEGAGGDTEALLPDDAPWQELFPAWPPDLQVCGKDILRFHAILWPALLLAAGLPPPRRVVVHGHWTVGRVKMSKSLGNVVDPAALLRPGPPLYSSPSSSHSSQQPAAWTPPRAAAAAATAAADPSGDAPWATADVVRFFLAREGTTASGGDDSDFSPSALQMRAAEIADGLGNLASRLLSGPLLPQGRVPRPELCDPAALLDQSRAAAAAAVSVASGGATETELQLVRSLCSVRGVADAAYAAGDPGTVASAAVDALVLANRAFTDAAPWALHKELTAAGAAAGEAPAAVPAAAAARLSRCLYLALETLRVVGCVLAPVTPLASATLLDALGFALPSSDAPARPLVGLETRPGGPAPAVAWSDVVFGAVKPAEYALPRAAGPPLVLFPKPPPASKQKVRSNSK